jgi:hypothetical protein
MMFLLGLLTLAVVVGGAALVVGGVFFWKDHVRASRADMWKALAERLGFDVVEAQDVPLREATADAASQPYQRFGLHRPRAIQGYRHLVRGSGAAVVRLGDVTERGDGLDDVTLATLEDPALDLPLFSVRPRGAYGAPSERPVSFREDPGFEARFEVFAPDTDAVRATLVADVRALLLARGPRWYWQGSGQTLAVEPGGTAEADETEALVAGLEAVAQVVPLQR